MASREFTAVECKTNAGSGGRSAKAYTFEAAKISMWSMFGYVLSSRRCKKMKISRVNSPNYSSRNGWKPDMIVNHITEGGYSGSVSWLCNPKSGASSHFVVGKNGEISQLVDLSKMAWCNGTSNDPKGKYYVGRSTLKQVRDRKVNANWYTVSIEHEGYSYKERFGKLTEKQYQATLGLHKFIIEEVKRLYGVDIPIDREHIVGHYQIAPREKPNCPSNGFPWDRLIADLRAWDLERKNANKGVKMKSNINSQVNNKKPINGQLGSINGKPINEPDPWAKTSWDWAKAEGIFDGTAPRREITRQEVATVLYRLWNKKK